MKREKAFQIALDRLLTKPDEEIVPDSKQTRRSVVDLFSPNHDSAIKKQKSIEEETGAKNDSDS